MSDPFVAEIRMFGFNFAPTGWAQCNGQLLPISQNTALFSLLGTMYGGDGKSTFALPNLEGAAPMFWGQGAGLSLYDQGQAGGVESVTLLESEIPTHTHAVRADGLNQADQAVPNPNRVLAVANGGKVYQNPAQPQSPMHIQSLSIAGGSLPHNNMMPYLVVNFCIAMQGIFPPRG